MHSADRVEVLLLMENWVDMLLPEQRVDTGARLVSRHGLIEHFDTAAEPPVAENGISLVVRAQSGQRRSVVVFDAGLTARALCHNIRVLHVAPLEIGYVEISHGHPDHYGGIYGLLEVVRHPVSVSTHVDAFLPRFATMGDGRTSAHYNRTLSETEIERRGGRLVLAREPIAIAPGIMTTGEIPRLIDFEASPSPSFGDAGLFQVTREGKVEPDRVNDEQALVIDVAGEGLVVLTGCAHAGVVNTVTWAQNLSGNRPVRAVIGGFHLGFPTTPRENIEKTVTALIDLDVKTIVPMHCSGINTHLELLRRCPDRYIQPAVGSTLFFGS
jgi:7,8-dihydropterin-6-yl-methyl-4-(beta-D-ribofuranosyl)aminobenzene 5'-phosphate synthase